MNLKFFRCKQCLSTFTINQEDLNAIDLSYYKQTLLCQCGGGTEYLGTAGPKTTFGRHHVIETGSKCACDERCTNATGPNCDCVCNGKNHGTKRVVPCILREGRYYAQQVDQKAFDRAAEFLMWLDTVTDLALNQLAAGNSMRHYRLITATREAKSNRVHKVRIEKLKKAYEKAMSEIVKAA